MLGTPAGASHRTVTAAQSCATRYQGVDWRHESSWHCNQRLNPYGERYNDGVSLNPYEVMFVKVKAHQLDLGALDVSTPSPG